MSDAIECPRCGWVRRPPVENVAESGCAHLEAELAALREENARLRADAIYESERKEEYRRRAARDAAELAALREAAQAVVDEGTVYAAASDKVAALRNLLASGESERSEEIRLPGLQCENCGRVCYDVCGGRACYGGSGGPGKRCGTMRGVWLRAVVGEGRL